MSKSSLREVIGEHMTRLGERNDKVVFVTADLSGTCRCRPFVNKFPERSFNTGVAEQNMASFAAGLAYEGFVPYVFSMSSFLSMRACEQVRTDIAYGNKNVKLMGIYAGMSGGTSGATHWSVEDIGIFSSIPNIAIFEVSDAVQARKMMDYALDLNGPVYIRYGIEPMEDLYNEKNIRIQTGGSKTVFEGSDGAFLCSGPLVQYAVQAAKEIMNEYWKSIRVVDLYSIKPVDKKAVLDAAATGRIIVAQDHNIVGGLGSIVSTVILEAGMSTKISILGITDKYVPMANTDYLYSLFGFDKEGLKKAMLRLFA